MNPNSTQHPGNRKSLVVRAGLCGAGRRGTADAELFVRLVTVTHTIAVLRDIQSDITVYHALTNDPRIALTFIPTLMNLYPRCEPFARTTLAIEWVRKAKTA